MILSVTSYAQKLTIMTYNIRHAEDMNGKLSVEQIAAVINRYHPDLVALQEVDSVTNRNEKVDQMKELGRLTGLNYSYGRNFAYDGGSYGLGTLSRYPVLATTSYRLPYYKGDTNGETRLMFMTDIRLPNGSSLRFGTVHLDYKTDTQRTIQTRDLLAQLHSEKKIPTIIAGDFNAYPVDECISIMKGRFIQLFEKDTTATYPSVVPKDKIDYIFLSKDHRWEMKEQQVIDEQVASDHRPVLGVVVLKE
jgi:endonuclease/exonuclease/phosphatase family metal-dependent hydrolase